MSKEPSSSILSMWQAAGLLPSREHREDGLPNWRHQSGFSSKNYLPAGAGGAVSEIVTGSSISFSGPSSA